MLKGLYSAYTGLKNEQQRMDVLTNNLANVNTVGFKKEGTTSQAFSDVLAFKIKDVTDGAGLAKRLGVNQPGVKIGENYTDYEQGGLKATEDMYDLALSGSGFFAVEYTNRQGETSTKYTRDGNFTLTTDGYLVTRDGDFVLDDGGGHIKIDPLKASQINADGEIIQDGSVAAKIQVTDFEDYDYLEKYGENFYQPVEGAEEAEAEAQVYAGYLELSNVSPVMEMVNMINVSRAYETSQKIIQTYNDSLNISANQIGKI